MGEAERYNNAWATGEYEPLIGLAYVRCLYRTLFFDGYKTLLDVGCGMGATVKYHREVGGIDAYGIDFAEPAKERWKEFGVDKWCTVASAEDIPFKDNTFEMVTCTDVLEHVPEEKTQKVLDEMFRVGNKDFFFSICLVPAKHKMPHDGSEPHINLHPPEWWIEKIGETGYRYTQWPYKVYDKQLFIQARKVENKHRRYKSLQQKLLYMPNEGQIQGIYLPHRKYAH